MQNPQKLECFPARAEWSERLHGYKVMIGPGVILHCDSLEKNSFYRNPRAGQVCGLFRARRQAGMLAFPRGDHDLAIGNYFGDSLMAFCCIAATID